MSGDELKQVREISIAQMLGKDGKFKFSICCPFHNEKTPSCYIYPDNSFHCYGCSAHGSGAIDFVMKMGFTFKEALEELKQYQ